MEILISFIVGIVLMEIYAWLDPLAMRIVRRAAKELPEDRQEEFMDQWEADLAAVPNSIMKVCYVFRDCLLPIKDIAQTMFRDDFERIADKSDLVFETIGGVVDRLMTRSEDVVQEIEIVAIKYISTLDFSLERLEQFHDNKDACSAIERVRAINPPLATQLSDYQSAVERNHAMIIGFAAGVREPLAKMAEASLRVKDRLRADSPLVEGDADLLDALYAPFPDLTAALDSFPNIEPPSADLSPSMKAAGEAIKAAMLSIKHARIACSPTNER